MVFCWRCRCVEEKVSRLPLFSLHPHLSLPTPWRWWITITREVTLKFSTGRPALASPLSDRCIWWQAALRCVCDMSLWHVIDVWASAYTAASFTEGEVRSDWWLRAQGIKVKGAFFQSGDKLPFDLIAAPAQTGLCVMWYEKCRDERGSSTRQTARTPQHMTSAAVSILLHMFSRWERPKRFFSLHKSNL